MKYLIILFLSLCLIPAYAQQSNAQTPEDVVVTLRLIIQQNAPDVTPPSTNPSTGGGSNSGGGGGGGGGGRSSGGGGGGGGGSSGSTNDSRVCGDELCSDIPTKIIKPKQVQVTQTPTDPQDPIETQKPSPIVTEIQPNPDESSILITLDRAPENTITIELPSDIIKNPNLVMVNDKVISGTFNNGTLSVLLPDGTTQFTVVGSWVVPEFGSMAIIILSITISLVILCKRNYLSY